jgi:hypothetical protein
MGGELLSNLVSLELLEAVRPELLVRFLRPFEQYLAARGVLLDGVTAAGAWIARLHEVLNAVDREMPPELQQALVDIADLTTESAHEHVLAIAKNQQLGLFAVNARTTPEDLAFGVYLDHRDLFRSAHARTQSAEVRRFVEFYAKDSTLLSGHLSAGGRSRLGSLLGAWFRERNRTGFCDVRVSEVGDEVSFVIIHGRPPRNHGAIESDDRRTRVTYVPDKHDVLVFDRRTGRLQVNAQFFREQDFYRRALGRVFWNDDDHFVARPVYTGEPLVEEGAAALDPHGVPGLSEVVLREVKVISNGKDGGVLDWKAHDLGPILDSPLGRYALLYGDVVQFQLAMVLTGRPRAVRVDVQVPNNLSYDRRVGGEVVREYLLESGFMRIQKPAPPAPPGEPPARGAA